MYKRQTLERTEEQQSLENFSALMQEVAKLPEDKRTIVAVYSQGVLAMAQAPQHTAR